MFGGMLKSTSNGTAELEMQKELSRVRRERDDLEKKLREMEAAKSAESSPPPPAATRQRHDVKAFEQLVTPEQLTQSKASKPTHLQEQKRKPFSNAVTAPVVPPQIISI